MSRRRCLLQHEIFVASRQRQLGVNTSKGSFTSAAYEGAFPRSLEFLLNIRDTNSLQYLFTEQFASSTLYIRFNDTPGSCLINYNGQSFPIIKNIGESLHIVITLEVGVGRVYVNGARHSEVQSANFIPLAVRYAWLGASSSYAFRSIIMLYRRYNDALSATDVTMLYNGGEAEKIVLPEPIKEHCDAEYIAQNIVGNGSVATGWLDSARQMPVGDFLVPMIGENGGNDLVVNKTPDIVYEGSILKNAGASTTGFGVDKSQEDTMEWIVT